MSGALGVPSSNRSVTDTSSVATLGYGSVAMAGSSDIPGARTNGTFVFLSSEMLMQYCGAQLKSLDTKIGTVFQAQEGMNEDTEVLGNLSTFMSDQSSEAKCKDPATARAIVAKYEEAIAAAKNPGVKEKLGDQLAQMKNGGINAPGAKLNPGQIHVEAVGTAISQLKTLSQSVANDSQLNMVQLGDLVSKRQQALQMCTNLMSSLSDAAKAIIQNMGR